METLPMAETWPDGGRDGPSGRRWRDRHALRSVIGDEILSGRTKDKNIGYIAEYLTNIGIDLKEVRVVPDEEPEIVAALNALRARYTYVFTTGGIGPTHDDITADCVAKAFGVAIGYDPRAVEIMTARVRETGGVMNEARMRMTRIPAGAELVLNKISAAPGFWIGNVIVMAGVPHIMQTMLEFVTPKLKTGTRMLSESVRADCREGDIGTELGADRQTASRRGDRFLSVHGRKNRRQHPRGGALAGCRKARRRQGGRRSDAGAGQSGDRGRQEVAAATGRTTRTQQWQCRSRIGPARRTRTARPSGRTPRGWRRKKSFRSRGTSFIAIPARSPGGSTASARSKRWSALPAAVSFRRRSWRANSASG